MKITFVLAGAGLILGFLYLISFPVRVSASAVDSVSNARGSIPALNAVPERVPVNRSEVINPTNDRAERGRDLKRQALPVSQKDLDHRVRSLFLFLQILRSQK